MHPMAFRKNLKSEEALQSELSVFRILHPGASPPDMRCYSNTSQDLGLSSGIPASDDSVAQLCGDRDEIEGRASTSHSNAGDGHGTKRIEATVSALPVVELEGGDTPRYNLSLCVSPVGEGHVLNEYKENEGWVVDKTHVRLSDAVGFAADGERHDVTRRYRSATFVEA